MRINTRSCHALVAVWAAAWAIGCGDQPKGPTTFAASTGLFHVQHDADWVTQEHEDGAGLMLATSAEALGRMTQGLAPANDGAAVNITLVPPELVQVMFAELAPDAPAEQVAQTIMALYASADGAPLPASRTLETDAGLAWFVPAPAGPGGLVILPLGEGTAVVATILLGPDAPASTADELTRAVIGSLVFDGTRAALLEALDLPILFPFG